MKGREKETEVKRKEKNSQEWWRNLIAMRRKRRATRLKSVEVFEKYNKIWPQKYFPSLKCALCRWALTIYLFISALIKSLWGFLWNRTVIILSVRRSVTDKSSEKYYQGIDNDLIRHQKPRRWRVPCVSENGRERGMRAVL